MVEWREEKYREIYESNLKGLERRRERDPEFGLADAEGTLRHLYIQSGNDQDGRGELQAIVMEATIAAYEAFLAAWRAERPKA